MLHDMHRAPQDVQNLPLEYWVQLHAGRIRSLLPLAAWSQKRLVVALIRFRKWLPKLGVPYWGPYYKGILPFGGLCLGSFIFVSFQIERCTGARSSDEAGSGHTGSSPSGPPLSSAQYFFVESRDLMRFCPRATNVQVALFLLGWLPCFSMGNLGRNPLRHAIPLT